jgi:hypothetical protein
MLYFPKVASFDTTVTKNRPKIQYPSPIFKRKKSERKVRNEVKIKERNEKPKME